MARVMFLVGCLAFVSATARADGWRQLDGKPAPEIAAESRMNVGGGALSRDALKGKVWLLNFFGIH